MKAKVIVVPFNKVSSWSFILSKKIHWCGSIYFCIGNHYWLMEFWRKYFFFGYKAPPNATTFSIIFWQNEWSQWPFIEWGYNYFLFRSEILTIKNLIKSLFLPYLPQSLIYKYKRGWLDVGVETTSSYTEVLTRKVLWVKQSIEKFLVHANQLWVSPTICKIKQEIVIPCCISRKKIFFS